MLLISTSESNGFCFIETAELDGFVIRLLKRTPNYQDHRSFRETNLKCRQALEETIALQDHLDQLTAFDDKKVVNHLYKTAPSLCPIFS